MKDKVSAIQHIHHYRLDCSEKTGVPLGQSPAGDTVRALVAAGFPPRVALDATREVNLSNDGT